MKSFTDILISQGQMTDKQTCHGYGEWYDLWLQPYRTTALNVLEVGVCAYGGGCVLALAEYFDNATIWSADIDDSLCVDAVFEHPRIKFLLGNAYDENDFLPKLEDTKFDVIIDDASHEVNDQVNLAVMLKPYLAPNGIYIVEDCCTNHWLNNMQKIWDVGYNRTIVDRATKTKYDNTIIKLTNK